MNLEEIFGEIFNEEKYQACRNHPMNKENPWHDLFNKKIPTIMKQLVDKLKTSPTQNYTCKGTIGKGALSDTFSFFVMNDSITRRSQDGVYIAYLVAPGGESIYLTLIQGTEIISSQAQLENRRRILTATGDRIVKAFKEYADEMGVDDYLGTFSYRHIDLGGQDASMTTQAYEIATLFSKEYKATNGVPSQNILEKDLKLMLSIYTRYQTLQNSGRLN